MKTKIAIVLVSLFFTSCLSYFLADENPTGIQISLINLTKSEYKNVKLTIGGIEKGNFVGTQSYSLPTVRVKKDKYDRQYTTGRWKPNLYKVKEISDKAYFTVQWGERTPVLLYNSFDDTKIVSAKITKNGVLKNEYKGNLSISFHKDSIKGTFHEYD